MYDWIRTAFGGPLVAAAAAGSAYLAVVVAVGALAGWLPPLDALAPSDGSVARGLLFLAAGTAGVFLLGALPAFLYGRAGLLLPTLAPVALLALLGYAAGPESYRVLVFVYPPALLVGAAGVGAVEYAGRRALAGGLPAGDPLVLAAAAGLVHAAVVTAALSLLGRSYLSEGALGLALVGPGLVLAVAGPLWLFLRLGLVGPLVGAPVGAALVVGAMATGTAAGALLETYAELSPYVFFVALLVGAVEYAVRGDVLAATPG